MSPECPLSEENISPAVWSLHYLSKIKVEKGHFESALAIAHQAKALCELIPSHVNEYYTFILLGDLYIQLGNRIQAFRYLSLALDLAVKYKVRDEIIRIQRKMRISSTMEKEHNKSLEIY